MKFDTIAAISSPFGEGAVALLRISGPDALAVADRVFRGKKTASQLAPRRVHCGAIAEGERRLDDVLLTTFHAPASYTGEPVAEIACHGGVLVTRRILELLLRSGARAALPGEFTQRAFLNGKLDLTQAEAVMDVITAQTDLALRSATEQLEGALGTRIRALRELLMETLAHVEAYIDFPDEDIAPETGTALCARLDDAIAQLEHLIAGAGQGRVLREGVRTVIFGAPNVGKSSLLNLLLGTERAIVSARPGTTRDVIEEVIALRGIPLRLADTAGVRESDDELERAGIERTRRTLERADLILEVCDASAAPAREPFASAAARVFILNKCDLPEHPGWAAEKNAVRLSCASGTGRDTLEAAIEDAVWSHAGGGDHAVAVNARHLACLERALAAYRAARRAFAENLSAEFIAEDLRAALTALGDILGRTDSEELLGLIFSRFCIGK